MRLILCALGLLIVLNAKVRAQPDDRREAVWVAVQARWQAWTQDDLDTYLGLHHPDWHRWGLHAAGLEDLEAVRAFWDTVKAQEETVAFRLDSVAVEMLGNGDFAAVHYVAHETVRLRQERVTRAGRTLPVGHEDLIRIRFSDFLVRDGDDWLYVGGYRDGGCALFRGFGRLCEE